MRSIYKDIGSRMQEDDFVAHVLEISKGGMYDTLTSTSLQAGKDYNQLEHTEDIVRLGYKAGHWTEKRYNLARMQKVIRMVDSAQRAKEFTKLYRQKVMYYLYNAVKQRRLGLINSFFEDLESKEGYGEKLLKTSIGVDDKFRFVNVIGASKTTAGLNAAYNALAVQSDQNGNIVGQQFIQWMFVEQNKAGAEELMHVSKYIQNNFGNLAEILSARFAAQYSTTTPTDDAVYLSPQHAIIMYGRQEIPVVTVKEDIEGLQVAIDDHAVIHCENGLGMVKTKAA